MLKRRVEGFWVRGRRSERHVRRVRERESVGIGSEVSMRKRRRGKER